MTQADKSKNIFQAAIDAVSNRDEKAAIEAAAKHAQELEQRISQMEQSAAQSAQKLADSEKRVADLTAELTKTKSDLAAVSSQLASANQTAFVSKQRLDATTFELQKYVNADQARQIAAAAEAAAKAQIIAEHKLTPDETLSHLSLKYYGSAYEPYWRVIYEANKDLIGPNPSLVRPGMVLKIPVLPEELKKK